METRYTMGVLALGVAVAVLLTPARRWLLSGWLWAGVGFSILIFLPNLIWQVEHHFISLEFLSYLHARDSTPGALRRVLPGTALRQRQRRHGAAGHRGPILLPFSRRRPPLPLLGWMIVVTFAVFAVVRSRSYYTAPL